MTNKSNIAITTLLYVFICCFLTTNALAAIPSLENLPQKAVDTLPTNDPKIKVVLFSNNTWKYFHPELDIELSQSDVYQDNWVTDQIFAYRSIELSDLPEVVELKLINDLDDFHYPIKGPVYSKYGPRGWRSHNGVDIPLKTGEPIFSTFEGKVRYAKYNSGGFGYMVIIRHSNGLETWYAHLSRINVEQDSYVNAGQVIGFGGSTGRSVGPHLHYEMRYCDQTFDPEFLIDFESGQLRYANFELNKSFFNIHSRATDQLEEGDDYILENINEVIAKDGETASEDILDRIAKAQTSSSSSKSSASVSSSGAVYHTIRSGDILGRIAIRYGVSIDQICRLNNITRTTTLRIGRKLRVK